MTGSKKKNMVKKNLFNLVKKKHFFEVKVPSEAGDSKQASKQASKQTSKQASKQASKTKQSKAKQSKAKQSKAKQGRAKQTSKQSKASDVSVGVLGSVHSG